MISLKILEIDLLREEGGRGCKNLCVSEVNIICNKVSDDSFSESERLK